MPTPGARIASRSDLVDHIKSTNGRMFRVTFVKRTTGEVRDMTARFGVTEHLKGGKLPFNASDKNVLIVFDMEKEAYRAINVDGILSAHIDNVEYVVAEIADKMKKKTTKRVRIRR